MVFKLQRPSESAGGLGKQVAAGFVISNHCVQLSRPGLGPESPGEADVCPGTRFDNHILRPWATERLTHPT